MQIHSISNGKVFTSKSFKTKNLHKNIAQLSIAKTSKSNSSNSILLYFAGLLSVFGLDKPLEKLINKLH